MAGGLTALWGDMQLGDGGPLVALRFDMDANAGLSECADARHQPAAEGFSSCHDGRMHACGHDGHMAIGLGLARVLACLRETCGDSLRGRDAGCERSFCSAYRHAGGGQRAAGVRHARLSGNHKFSYRL